ncbi:MAG: xanthan lyase, partial [Bacteroidales bacterium]|nr:xanthan lyase [Bacteroidales bacterium]
MLLRKSYLTFCAIFLISGLLSAQTYQKPEEFKPMADSIKQYLLPKAAMKVPVAVDSVVVTENSVEVHFNRYLADYALRDNTVKELNQIASLLLPQQYKGKKVTLHSANSSIEVLASEFYSEKYNASLAAQNKKKKSKSKKGQEQPVRLVTNMSRPYQIENGLDGKHIAMWQSHGWYYDQPLMRWEWQRARIFETVEDLYTQSYVVPFLVPMLENAGANVLLPRERDYSIKEYIVDNDKPMKGYKESNGDYEWVSGTGEGFANPKNSYVYGENPFTMGTFRQVNGVVKTKKHTPVESVAKWIPEIHFLQELAVYVSYKTIENSTDAAYYTVKYKGGS